MLKKGIKYFILLVLLSSCNQKNEKTNHFYETSVNKVGYKNYRSVLLKLYDSIEHWKINEISLFYIDTNIGCSYLDTLLCFNNTSDRFITCILTVSKNRSNPTGVLNYFFGEKQNDCWYFFPAGTSVFIPNAMKINRETIFFDYRELHSAAIANIYSGYLLPNGQINERWFKHNFENIGWGDFNNQKYFDRYFKGKRYADIKEFYKACHLVKVKNNWAYRDTTKSIIPFSAKSLP